MVIRSPIYHSYRITLPDGRKVYLAYNPFTGPFFFYDRRFHRPIKNWLNDQDIIKTFFWFLHRGCKA